ncbi:MAG TPA: hypothetical protein DCP97_00990 [Ruminococcaceae bacterium]|nr:hypothetical protein [Oscillospiraceae bacterium]
MGIEYMAANLQALQSTMSMYTMQTALGRDSQAMAKLLEGFAESNPQVKLNPDSIGANLDICV